MNITSLDLNLLKVFEALAEERSATRAGARVGLTQSSVSNALNRLRQVFGDDLFVRTPQGMMPTPRALALEQPVRSALNGLRDALTDSAGFDVATTTGKVRIATSDILVVALGSRLLRAITSVAPGVDLRFLPLDKRTVFGELDEGRIDFAIGTFGQYPQRLFSRALMPDRFICAARRGHPALEGGLTLDRFTAYPHVLMSLMGDDRGAVDTALAEIGRSRRVGVTVGHFLSVPTMLAETDYLSAVPASARQIMMADGLCETAELPIKMADWTVELLWSRRADTDPLQSWARNRLVDIISTRTGPPNSSPTPDAP
ncbi:MAG: LysR family transcriptional regulator [Pseudomonadota bacterium]